MARMVSVEEGISIKELERRVLVEFRAGELEYGVALSYWPPDSLELAIGIKTPPEVEKLEERMKAESNTTGACDFSGCNEGIDSDYSGPEEIDERDVRPRGYDYEFWEPLIAGDLGGSNAVEVVLNDKEAEGLVKMEEARRPYSCYTNNAFDHMVDPGGSSEWERADNKDEEPMDDFAWMGKTSLGGHETGGQETHGHETGVHCRGTAPYADRSWYLNSRLDQDATASNRDQVRYVHKTP
ncbi:hypothetical protein DY000_02041811 [Brassica cretica]|uniref:Uncharacterized protein n=1 Tax=Brassica cretica TaxID=69181 RepID=A0ABQ7B842_BRACR|nr:hypothetical protein DY000_02041811 [Brassica cretica]